MKLKQVVCPYCGYRMPVFYGEKAVAKEIYMTCKGKKCKKQFEVRIHEDK